MSDLVKEAASKIVEFYDESERSYGKPFIERFKHKVSGDWIDNCIVVPVPLLNKLRESLKETNA